MRDDRDYSRICVYPEKKEHSPRSTCICGFLAKTLCLLRISPYSPEVASMTSRYLMTVY